MLRVGLTGGLGSGKSTIGRLLAELGCAVVDADEVGRRLMQPGEAVYDRIVDHFGPEVVRADGSLDRPALARLAFDQGRVQELNRIVHPPVIAAQEEWMRGIFADDPAAVAIIESALIFEASGQEVFGQSGSGSLPGWRDRFDRIILVTAPDEMKVRRFVERGLARSVGDPGPLAAEARKRIAAQLPDHAKLAFCDWVIDNSGTLEATREAVVAIYADLRLAAGGGGKSLK